MQKAIEETKMAISKYQDVFDNPEDGLVQRNVSLDDDAFAKQIAEKLFSLLRRRYRPISDISTGLQGNLCEFCAWELGESHWLLYTKEFSWPANAKTPWRDHSKSGVDILAVSEKVDAIHIIEVKSTKTGGSSVVASDQDSLKEDFEKLFAIEAPEKRIWGSVNEAVADLTIHGYEDLAEKMLEGVGDTPQECTAVHLVGVLICKSGSRDSSRQARSRAFEKLDKWLQSEGWSSDQCHYQCVELNDFQDWLWKVVRQMTR